MRRWWYALYTLAIVALLGAAEWRGWGLLQRQEEHGVSPTVRNNPGAYRSHYRGGGRYLHGK